MNATQRLQVAGDLQDLVAHRVSAIEVHAAAMLVRHRDTPGPHADLTTLLELAHDAMAELARLRHVVDGRAPLRLQPAPTLELLPELIPIGAAQQVRVELGGDLKTPVPAGVALCAYRCIETLVSTAARKDGGDIRAEVRRTSALLVLSCTLSNRPDVAAIGAWLQPCGGVLRERDRDRWDLVLSLTP
ncbi:MAG: hypothetical protein JHC95_17880 [Solirubrobacteraceae bacterium]|nr:hypothetical protein [Solirubrobacteraceae bacterium]